VVWRPEMWALGSETKGSANQYCQVWSETIGSVQQCCPFRSVTKGSVKQCCQVLMELLCQLNRISTLSGEKIIQIRMQKKIHKFEQKGPV
jgi:hypothetical protein